ncbi:class I SAM-dependent methyltransferase [Homoserinibacter sp. YIM 151385]|uniref:class I SAM-dependent methyltransferase n=1 Tax=Homoserinibacter sp. YIM 151385 TaxID=2985506 RepID=UPI0022F0B7C6|nr:class I SAM-dependent methyltransferase [Homoserinibacter sp. YIM 151385]WBU38958.1 class I SAM-dependent methyltransferase [Homoserinibacter sp. YIM 151385]
MTRFQDGSAGDADYGTIGKGYASIRRADPRIEQRVWAALGSARRVLNVGAGGGSYEPVGLEVTAVEPSASMRAERPPTRVPAIDATAQALPFDADVFDASMASVTIHQWPELEKGLQEMRRVTRGPVVLLTFDPVIPEEWWMPAYVPEIFEVEGRRMPSMERLRAAFPGDDVEIETIPVPADCVDGFGQSFFARPERVLDPAVRRASMSAWTFVEPEVVARFERELGADLASGEFDRRWGRFRELESFDVGLRLVIATPPAALTFDV